MLRLHSFFKSIASFGGTGVSLLLPSFSLRTFFLYLINIDRLFLLYGIQWIIAVDSLWNLMILSGLRFIVDFDECLLAIALQECDIFEL